MKHTKMKHLLTVLSVLAALCVAFFLIGLKEHVAIPAYVELSQSTADSDADIISSNSITCIDEDNYSETMKNIVEPYLDSIKTTGYISSFDDARIYYEYFTVSNPIGTVIISHGFSEPIEKYNEMIYYFTQKGYSTYILQHRGHGLSMRYTKDESLVYINDFDTYVKDFDVFIQSVVSKTSESDYDILFGHSMGACIGAMYLSKHPGFFDRAVLSSPMFEINTGSTPAFAAKMIAKAASITKFKFHYVPGNTAYSSERNFSASTYLSEARYNYVFDICDAQIKYHTNAASYGWLNAAFQAADEITSKKAASKIKIPVLLFQAENDTMVNADGQYKFTDYSQNTSLILVDGGKHDLFCSDNEILEPYLNKLFSFIE